MISTTIFLYLVSKAKDRTRNKKVFLLSGFLIRAIVWLLFIYVDNIFSLVLLQILLGLGEALGTPSFEALFAEHLDQGKHISEYSEWKLIVNATSGLAVILGGISVQYFGFNILFISMACLAMISFFGLLLKKA